MQWKTTSTVDRSQDDTATQQGPWGRTVNANEVLVGDGRVRPRAEGKLRVLRLRTSPRVVVSETRIHMRQQTLITEDAHTCTDREARAHNEAGLAAKRAGWRHADPRTLALEAEAYKVIARAKKGSHEKTALHADPIPLKDQEHGWVRRICRGVQQAKVLLILSMMTPRQAAMSRQDWGGHGLGRTFQDEGDDLSALNGDRRRQLPRLPAHAAAGATTQGHSGVSRVRWTRRRAHATCPWAGA